MKKKWTILMLVVLLVQSFSPLVALAETTGVNSTGNTISLSEVVIADSDNVDPENAQLTVKGQVTTTENLHKEIRVTGMQSNANGTVVTNAQQSIGTFQASGNAIKIQINASYTGYFELSLKGQLLDKTTNRQVIEATLDQSFVTKGITLKEPVALMNNDEVATTETSTEMAQENTTENTTSETTESTSGSESAETSVSTETGTLETTETESVTTESVTEKSHSPVEKVAAKRAPINISELFSEGKKFFTGVEVLGEDGQPINGQAVELGDLLKMNFEYAIPEDVREQMEPGDFYEAQLPAEVKVKTNIKFELKNEFGDVYGVGLIDTNGKIRIDFNEKVDEESAIHGVVTVSGEFQQGGIPNPGPVEIDFPFVEEEEGIPIIVKPTTDETIRKTGHPDRQLNPNQLIWNVDVNVGMDTHTNAVITENFPAGTKYESVKVYKAKVDFSGKIIEGEFEEMVEGKDYTVDASGKVTFKGVITDAYRLEYTTSINQATKPGAEGGSVEYKNTASISSDELTEPLPAEATITGKYNKALEKIQPGYDPSKQEFKWTVRYNYTEYDIPTADAKFTDSFTSNMILDEGSFKLYKVTFGSDGKPVRGAALETPKDYTLIPTAGGKGFEIKFNGKMDYAVDIEYVTKVNEEVNGNQNYGNSIIDGSGNTGWNTGNAKQQGLIKGIQEVDYTNKTITWKIDVNQNNYELNNWKLEDTMSPGLKLSEGTKSFVIKDITANKTLAEGTDYTIVYDEKAGKINVVYIGKYAKTSNKFQITYQTDFDTKVLNAAGKDTFLNSVTSTWTNKDGTESTSHDEEPFKPNKEEREDGFKSGNYNAVDKKITWTFGINYNAQKLGDVKISDPITSNQKFVPDSLKVFRYTIGKNGKIIKGAELSAAELARFTVTEPTATANTLGINISDVEATDQFYFEFETSLVGEVVNSGNSYKNVATVDAKLVDGTFNIEGTVSIANGGSLIQKSGKQDEDGFLQWSATINPSQSTVHDPKITDKPTTNQVIDEQSVILYETIVDKAGKISKGAALDKSKYTVSLTTDSVTGQQELVIVFMDKKIERAYILEYKAFLLLSKPSGEKVSNKIKLEGNNKIQIEEEISKEIEASISEGGGTAVGEAGKLEIRKVDANKKVLTGATFELWDKKNAQKLREGDVSEAGTLLFGKLPYGEYILKETKAPVGHTISDDLVTGRKVQINKETAAAGFYLDVVNELNRVTLVKESEATKKLAGAVFKLEQFIKGKWQAIDGKEALTTDSKGEIIVEGLVAGKYRFTETKAPEGYILDETPIEFEVLTNAQNQTPAITVTAINYLGNASFIKKDGNNLDITLAGATFKVKQLTDATGKEVNQEFPDTYTSDQDGRVTLSKLAPGTYEITEITAPSGYLINTAKLRFEIKNQQAGKPAPIEIADFLNYQGSVELVKTNEDDQPLAGAVFQLKDAEGKNIGAPVTTASNGKITIEGLVPGKYTLHETQAPAGYIVNTKPIAFEVATSANGKPAVIQTGSFINYQGSIRLKKVNTSGETLSGAEFGLFASTADPEKDAPLGRYTSNDKGQIEINDLVPGAYKLIELKAPDFAGGKYVKNPYPVHFEIPTEYVGEVKQLNLGDFQNFKGKAVISKTDDSGEILVGSEFELYALENGSETLFQDKVLSDDKGKLNIDNLPAGFYKLIETKAPEGFLVNTNPIYFTVETSGTGGEDAFAFQNYQSTIEFRKTDIEGTVLKDATFNIYKATEEGGKVGAPINPAPLTAVDNKYTYVGLEVGNYVLEEVKAADGFIKNTELYAFEVEAQIGKPEVIVLADFINYQGAVSFIKTNNEGQPLADAEFTLYQEEKELQKVTVDDTGKVYFDKLVPGTYQIKETKAAPGYILNTTVIDVTIDSEVVGEPAEIKLADFINYKGSVSFIKKDQAGKPLVGAEFTLYQGDKAVQKMTASDTGKIQFNELLPGDYTIKETKAAPGYILNTKVVDVTIDSEVTGEPVAIELVDFINYKGSVSFTKTDKDGKGLAGAEFTLSSTKEGFESLVVVSDIEGNVQFDELSPGNYQIKETKAAPGYILNTTVMDVTIDSETTGEPVAIELADFINYKGSISFVKTDEEGLALYGSTFTLFQGEKEIKSSTSEIDGKVRFDELAPGEYVIRETKATSGFILNTQSIPVSIGVEAAGANVDIVLVDTFINYQGSVSLTKTDETGKGLAGAKFGLYDEAGKEIDAATSNQEGKIVFDHITPGTYEIKEMEAPVGYILNTTTMSVTIEKEAAGEPEVVELDEFINYQGAVEVTKVDKSDATKVLQGAEFKLTDSKGVILKEKLVTDQAGKIFVDQLAPGTYDIVETKAPKGYQLTNKKVTFVISDKQEGKPSTQLVTITNEKKKESSVKPTPVKPTKPNKPAQKLPQAGEADGLTLSILGILLITSVTSVFSFKRFRKKA